jgi:hypothetical protein
MKQEQKENKKMPIDFSQVDKIVQSDQFKKSSDIAKKRNSTLFLDQKSFTEGSFPLRFLTADSEKNPDGRLIRKRHWVLDTSTGNKKQYNCPDMYQTDTCPIDEVLEPYLESGQGKFGAIEEELQSMLPQYDISFAIAFKGKILKVEKTTQSTGKKFMQTQITQDLTAPWTGAILTLPPDLSITTKIKDKFAETPFMDSYTRGHDLIFRKKQTGQRVTYDLDYAPGGESPFDITKVNYPNIQKIMNAPSIKASPEALLNMLEKLPSYKIIKKWCEDTYSIPDNFDDEIANTFSGVEVLNIDEMPF